MRTLIQVGCNSTKDVLDLIQAHDLAILFEPLPDAAEILRQWQKAFRSVATIIVVQAAVLRHEKGWDFRRYNEKGLSSSLGIVSDQARELYCRVNWTPQEIMKVNCVSLADYMPYEVTTLKIDAQGCDLEILKSIDAWVTGGRIETIEIEVDGKVNDQSVKLYHHLPDNSEDSLIAYMADKPYSGWRKPGRVDWNPDYTFVRKSVDIAKAI